VAAACAEGRRKRRGGEGCVRGWGGNVGIGRACSMAPSSGIFTAIFVWSPAQYLTQQNYKSTLRLRSTTVIQHIIRQMQY
jgi:hypothetical protein